MSQIQLTQELLARIQRHGEEAYPDEGAGFLVGSGTEQLKHAVDILALPNVREESARHNRYLIAAEDYLQAELSAERLGLDLIGVFHSHPDSANAPSEYDRDWAQPLFSYIITSVNQGKAAGSRSWRLAEDRTRFIEEDLTITEGVSQ